MKTIHQLTPDTISRIAAGEIIERPAYALKELIENSLDAGATRIDVTLENHGLDLIEVTDNGIGMSPEDLHEAIKPHTTSKIRSDDPLTSIHTFGFRGEALASIAAVSYLIIESKTNNNPGMRLVIDQGREVESHTIGMDTGTRIQVRNLFAATPARKQFLASPRMELHQLQLMLTLLALSHPQVSFSLSHNTKKLVQTFATQSIDERLTDILGMSFTQYLFPITMTESFIKLQGFLSHPVLAQKNDGKVYLFVNNRPVKDPLIMQAVREAYGSLLATRSYPPCVLFMTIPFERIDVNIHPRKEQIKFLDKDFVFQTLVNSIRELLQIHNLTFANVSWRKDAILPLGVGERKLPENSVLSQTLKEHIAENLPTTYCQIDNTYVIITDGKKLILMDQHAADERILFEKLQQTLTSLEKEKNLFQLKTPILIDLSQAEKTLLLDQQDLLMKLGIGIDDFEGKSIKLVSIPVLMQDYDPNRLVADILSQLQEFDEVKNVDKLTQQIITTLSCRYAIMAGQMLTESQMKNLWEKLQRTSNNATCPHGRPTHIEITIVELKKIFKR